MRIALDDLEQLREQQPLTIHPVQQRIQSYDSRANLSDTNLSHANFIGANLIGALQPHLHTDQLMGLEQYHYSEIRSAIV
jgi:Pentapeptide repeats (8 copies)